MRSLLATRRRDTVLVRWSPRQLAEAPTDLVGSGFVPRAPVQARDAVSPSPQTPPFIRSSSFFDARDDRALAPLVRRGTGTLRSRIDGLARLAGSARPILVIEAASTHLPFSDRIPAMSESDRRMLRVRRARLEDQGAEDDLAGSTVEERLNMMWQLALDAWAFKGELVVEPRLPRHVVRLIRREG
jgi:hypothetical protein